MDDSIRYREPVDIPDGQYEGRRSGYRLSWEFDGREVDVMTSIGIRGINVRSRFEVRDGKVVESSIKTIGPSTPLADLDFGAGAYGDEYGPDETGDY